MEKINYPTRVDRLIKMSERKILNPIVKSFFNKTFTSKLNEWVLKIEENQTADLIERIEQTLTIAKFFISNNAKMESLLNKDILKRDRNQVILEVYRKMRRLE